MAQIIKKLIAANAVDGSKIKFANNENIKARNAADSADVNILKVNASDVIEFASIPQAAGTPSNANDLVNKAYADGLTPSGVVLADGSVPFTADQSMGGFKLTSLAAPTSANDAVRKVYVDDADALLIPLTQKGAANGVASLDGAGKVPVAQLPSAVMTYEGVWNASTNSPTLADGTGDAGQVYRVGTAGSQNLGSGSISFSVGDYVIYNGSTWEKSDTTDAVASVNGATGVVVLDTDDISEGSTNKYQAAWGKENLTLNGTDITNQYKDLAQVILASSMDVVFQGIVQREGTDYTVSLTGGAGGNTRVSFAGDLATAGAAALISGDVLVFKYQY